MNVSYDNPEEAGFSLVEILVVLSLLSLISLATVGLFQQYATLSKRQLALENRARISSLMNFVRSEIENARQLPLSLSDPVAKPIFMGTSKCAKFVALAAPSLNATRLRDVELCWINSESTVRLIRNLHTRGSQKDESETIDVVGGIASVGFQYLRNSEESKWEEYWDDTTKIPSAVRINAQTSNGNTVNTAAYTIH